MVNAKKYCATTLKGGTCTDGTCLKLHDSRRCEPCDRIIQINSLQDHQSGKKHLQKVASSGLPNSCTPQQAPPSQSTSSNLKSAPPANALPPFDLDKPHFQAWVRSHAIDINPPAGDKVAYCATALQGDTCMDHRCQYRHDILRCEPCRRSFPASLLSQHQSGKSHLLNVASNGSDIPSTSHRSLSTPSVAPNPQPSPPQITLPPSRGSPFTSDAGPPVFVSHEDGLDFGTGIVVDSSFPPINHTIVVESTSSSLSVRSMTLVPSPSPCFVASLLGKTVEVRPQMTRKILVEFKPPCAGTFHAALKITLGDKADKEFTVIRDLRGHAILPEDPSSDGGLPNAMGSKGVGITVSHDSGLKLSVKRSSSDEPYTTQTEALVITKSTVSPSVSFKSAKIQSSDGFVPTLAARDQGHKQSGSAHSQSINARTDANTSSDEEEFLDCDGTGISVSHEDGLDFGIVERKHLNGRFAAPSSLLTIKLADGFPSMTFVKERTRTVDGSDPEFVAVFEGDSLSILPGTESTVRVIFSPKFEGVFKATLELVFYHSQLSAGFAVRRKLQGIAGSLDDHRHLEALGKEDDGPTESSREVPPRKIILLFPPNRCRNSRSSPDYRVSPIIQEAVDGCTVTRPYDDDAPSLLSALRPDSLNMDTYARYFGALLNIEDGHQQWVVLCQPPYEVNVQRRGQCYSVEIENDDEDLLPEVIVGDFLWLDDIQDDIRYEARITDLDVFARQHLAVLKMSFKLARAFVLYKGAQFVLRFRHNRTTLRHQYHALATSLTPPRRLLFPSVSDIKPMRRLSRTEIYNLKCRHLVNRDLRDDDQQLQAVVSILEQPRGSVPFIIYGPPGTGKTSTIVESIVQLVRRDASVRVLACAPSDAATDLLLERLAAVGLDSDKLYRLNSSLYYEDEDEQIPGHERLLAFRVVLSTCSSASVLQALNVPVGHFSHIVIDEAAQAEEPLVMIPILTFSYAYTNIILAGDPNELGPMIKSPTAAEAGLGKSYLQRLMLIREVYGLDTQVGNTIVVLRRNRRSHGAIIAWSNRYLYEDMMRDCGNAYITYHLVLSEALPKKGFPVVFHGVKGSEQHTKWSKSYFNVLEASIVRNYCVKLTGDPERKIYPEEVGVLSPYKGQVRAIKELLKVAKLSDILVGSVEHFQGQERKVIILATTRSNEESNPRKALSYLVNRQHMNVAITRAQALLIVIGDPEVLGKYEHWRTFLDYIKSRKGWTGRMQNWKLVDVPLPGYEIIPRKGGVAYGEEFIGGKNDRTPESNGG